MRFLERLGIVGRPLASANGTALWIESSSRSPALLAESERSGQGHAMENDPVWHMAPVGTGTSRGGSFFRMEAWLALTAICLLWPCSGLSQGGQRQVLVVNSENVLLPMVTLMNESLFEAIKSHLGNDVEIRVEWLDLNRFNSPALSEHLASAMENKYRNERVVGVVAVTEGALGFLGRHRQRLFPEVPIVHMAVQDYRIPHWNGQMDIYGAGANYDPVPNFRFALKAHPGTKRFVVITGVSPMDKAWEAYIRERARTMREEVEFEFWAEFPIREILMRLPKLGKDTVVLTPGIFCDGAGEWMIGAEAIRRFASACRCPLYSMFPETAVQKGCVGGIGPDYRAMGPQAARILAEVLAGREPAESGTVSPLQGFFDWRELRRWGVREGDLPGGSVVVNRVPGFWESYWHWILLAAGVILMQSSFISALLVQRRRRALAERELAEKRRELTHLTRVSMLGELAGTLSHEFSQPLATILTSAQAAQSCASHGRYAPEIQVFLQSIVRSGRRAADLLDRLRAMIRREETPKRLVDLNEVVREVLALMRGELSVRRIPSEVSLSEEELMVKADPIQLQQIVVNLLFNACEAMTTVPPADRRVEVSTASDPKGIAELRVSDQGTGFSQGELERIFDPFFTTKSTGMGMGMAICRQIADEHGASIGAFHRDGRGATFVLRIPLHSLSKPNA